MLSVVVSGRLWETAELVYGAVSYWGPSEAISHTVLICHPVSSISFLYHNGTFLLDSSSQLFHDPLPSFQARLLQLVSRGVLHSERSHISELYRGLSQRGEKKSNSILTPADFALWGNLWTAGFSLWVILFRDLQKNLGPRQGPTGDLSPFWSFNSLAWKGKSTGHRG